MHTLLSENVGTNSVSKIYNESELRKLNADNSTILLPHKKNFLKFSELGKGICSEVEEPLSS